MKSLKTVTANELIENCKRAKEEGISLTKVFKLTAEKHNLASGSVRNFYYKLVGNKQKFFDDINIPDSLKPAFIEEFSKLETESVIEKILLEKTNGKSVRQTVYDMACGNPKLALRYQNKYRSALKNDKASVEKLVEKLTKIHGKCYNPYATESRFNKAEEKLNLTISNLLSTAEKEILALESKVEYLTIENKKLKITASQLIERVRQIHDTRFKYHNIIFSSPVLTKENADFKIEGPGNLLLSSLSNIIDNAIYWVKVQSELTSDKTYRKAIYVGSDVDSFDGPAILIADTGTGFNMEPEDMIQPFRTMRPEGMGLGLYYVNLVMETIGGKLLFPDREKYDVPKVYNGAFVVLVFPKINL